MELVRGLTVGGLLHQTAGRYPERPALIYRKRIWTYAELDSETDEIARGMMASGIGKGEHTAIWAGNFPQTILTLYSLLKIGAVPVMIGLRDKGTDLMSRIRQSGADYLFYSGTIRQINANQVVQTADLEGVREAVLINKTSEKDVIGLKDIRERGREISEKELREREAQVRDTDTDLMLFTSGSSGTPKCVALTHFARVNNAILQAEALHVTCEDRFLCCIPLFHCFALNAVALCALSKGACLCLPDNFHTEAILRGIEEYRCTVFTGVPTVFSALMAREDFDRYDLSSLRTGIMAGSCYPPTLFQKVRDRMGYGLVPALGLTETTGGITCGEPDDSQEVLTRSVGRFLPHVEGRICSKEGEILPVGKRGEICVRGYCVMKEYYNAPEVTAKAFDEDGFFHTGDMGYMDSEGNLYITGRIKDLIIRGGENISPGEIEDLIDEDDRIEDVVVLGVPDHHYMEEICACFISADEIPEEEIRQIVRSKAAPFKVPRYVLQFKSFPKTSTGKVDKRELRKIAMEKLGLTDLEFSENT